MLTRDRVHLGALLAATAVLYLWNITINGTGNAFYAAAAWSGSRDVVAWLFGSLDPGNFITVDKPPLSQWAMGLSGWAFGFSSASLLVPEALMAVASVALLYGAVARLTNAGAGLLAGGVLALMPVAALMFRFDNPDAAMVLAMTAAAYCTVRALGRRGGRWMAWAGVALGLAFLAKMGQGLLVAPSVVATYLLASPVPVRRRLAHVAGCSAAAAVSAGWYVLLTMLWPAPSRPYIAGSVDNSFVNLAIGKNGASHLSGGHHGAQSAAWQSTPGLPRLFSGEIAAEIGWFLPAALLCLGYVLYTHRAAPRTDAVRAAAVLFGGWLLVGGAVLSFMPGNIHPYYCLCIAPAAAALVAVGVHTMRRQRHGRWVGAVVLLVSGVWAWRILGWNPQWMPTLRWIVLAASVTCTALLALPVRCARNDSPGYTEPDQHRSGWLPLATVAGVAAVLLGPAAYTVATIGQPHDGGRPLAGPASSVRQAGVGGRFLAPPDDPAVDDALVHAGTQWSAAVIGSNEAAVLELGSRTAVMAIGGYSGTDPVPSLAAFTGYVRDHRVRYFIVDPQGTKTGTHQDITAWVESHFALRRIGRDSVYDLDVPALEP